MFSAFIFFSGNKTSKNIRKHLVRTLNLFILHVFPMFLVKLVSFSMALLLSGFSLKYIFLESEGKEIFTQSITVFSEKIVLPDNLEN